MTHALLESPSLLLPPICLHPVAEHQAPPGPTRPWTVQDTRGLLPAATLRGLVGKWVDGNCINVLTTMLPGHGPIPIAPAVATPQCVLRSPMAWAQDISRPTYAFEGDEGDTERWNADDAKVCTAHHGPLLACCLKLEHRLCRLLTT